MRKPATYKAEVALAFGPFQLFRTQKVLLEGGVRVRLGSRGLDILIALVERPGEVVSKKELMALVWPDTFVDESNLRVHIAGLRKLLGDGRDSERYIVNVAGRGYSFVAPVTRADASPDPNPEPAEPPPRDLPVLPANPTRLIGREGVVASLQDQFLRRRFVTIVGPGGMGKSTVAVALAEALVRQKGYRAAFINLAPLESGAPIFDTVATTLGVSALKDDPVASLAGFLAKHRSLLIFDNCEHVLDAVAPLVERILAAAPGVDIIATSREPVQVRGEWVHRLPALETPPPGPPLSRDEMLAFPAVQLFVERAVSSLDSASLDAAEIAAIASICRQVDGMPLAIELVAARADLFGVLGLEKALEAQILTVAKGARTALPRLQSLRGALDWSYALLSSAEQATLRRLSMFRGPFAPESASAVAADTGLSPGEVLESIVSLAAKSLVVADTTGSSIRYRLLHVTRVYAAERLAEADEDTAVRRRHADHYRRMFEQAEPRWEVLTRADWLAEYGYAIEDVRAALDWAFGPDGDLELGATLTAATLPFGYQMSLIDEFRRRAELALTIPTDDSPARLSTALRICNALIVLYMNTATEPAAAQPVIDRARGYAQRLGVTKHRIGLQLGEMVIKLELGQYDQAVASTNAIMDLAVELDSPLAVLLADRAAAQTQHFAGDHARARQLAERVIRHPAQSIPLVFSQTSVDRQISMRVILARVLWMEGKPEAAAEMMRECLGLAYADSPFSLCQALALAGCPLALWLGDDDWAEQLIGELLDYTSRFTMERWNHLGRNYRHALLRRRGGENLGRERIVAGSAPISTLHHDLLVTVDEAAMDEAQLARALAGDGGWCRPELLRCGGELRLRQGDAAAGQEAEALFEAAMAAARAQGARPWELRAATSLTALLNRQGRTAAPENRLETVLANFAPDVQGVDILRARQVLLETANRLRTC